MGVHGLWRLIEPSGRPVPLETLENKILAVDVSIWLHQAVKGFQDSKGQPLPNAHLLGIYHRVCKLLYFRIKPVFVFDGGIPALKKETIAKRNQLKSKNNTEADRLQKQLINTLLKHTAISKVLSDKAKASLEQNLKVSTSKTNQEDLYLLPPQQNLPTLSSSSSENEEESTTDNSYHWDLHSIDMDNPHFKSLPADMRHEILTDLKETRKQSSWGRLHELPTQSDDFSSFQMNRLRKRHRVQVTLEELEQEMGGRSLSLGELESLLRDQGVIKEENVGSRIASDENTRYLLIKDVQKAMEKAKAREIGEGGVEGNSKADLELDENLKKAIEMSLQGSETEGNKFVSDEDEVKEISERGVEVNGTADLELEGDLQRAIEMSLKCDKKEEGFVETFNDFISDDDDDEGVDEDVLVSAKMYMTEYSGLTPAEIANVIGKNVQKPIPNVKSKKVNLLFEKNVGITEDTLGAKIERNYSSLSTIKEVESPNIVTTTEVDENHTAETATNKIVESSREAIEIMSDSDLSDDFVEVAPEKSTATENCMQIVVDTEQNLDDDIFADVFENTSDSKAVENNTEPEDVKQGHEMEVTSEPKAQQSELVKEILEKLPSERNVSFDELRRVEESLSKESSELIAARGTKEKLASNITDQMYQEAQELLQLFGVPYVVAPMEAEAQCAYLDEINLTDGTITDDSDIWLFGGKTVYKNFFNQTKHVVEFRTENIQHHFKLTRHQMILFALLVGSDYTTGLQGVGPVTALEVLASFPPTTTTTSTPPPEILHVTHEQLLTGLREFRGWLSGEKTKRTRRNAGLKAKLRNVKLSDNFPSTKVVRAYLEPTVETSEERFTWGRPDLVGLVDFARVKFGWSRRKSEEILRPVVKRLEEAGGGVQRGIKDYFMVERKVDAVEQMMSKRVKLAVERFGKEEEDDGSGDDVAKGKKGGKGKKKRKKYVEGEAAQSTCSSKPKNRRRKLYERKKTQQHDKDEELEILKKTEESSKVRVAEIERDAKERVEEAKRKRITGNLHVKEVVPQREKDKADLLRSKLKAIEMYRKSKNGPGFVKKRPKVVRQPKEDAELSSNSSSE